MAYAVLLRHGESQWNRENRFTGWTDGDLSEEGREQARTAGRLPHGGGFTFDLTYTSYLKRAIRTLWIALDHMDRMWLPVVKDWRLNERHYGAEQVHRWRRGFDVRPPRLEPDDPRSEAKYHDVEWPLLPGTESLADTVNRVLPCWRERIMPRIRAGQDVLVAAHGNSLRALVKDLDGVSDEAVTILTIPSAVPRIYELGDGQQIRRRYYLREGGEEPIGG